MKRMGLREDTTGVASIAFASRVRNFFFERKLMKQAKFVKALAIALAMSVPMTAVRAEGCIKGAAAGAVVGHVAGHHAILGAMAGCAIGHHMAKKEREQRAMRDARYDAHHQYGG